MQGDFSISSIARELFAWPCNIQVRSIFDGVREDEDRTVRSNRAVDSKIFFGFFFVIALARFVVGMFFGWLGHFIGFLLLDSIAVTLSLIGTGLLPLIAFPILFIGQFTIPSLGSLDASLGTIAIGT